MSEHTRPLPVCEKEFSHITESLRSMEAKIDRICTAIEGNGSVGMRIRIDRLEQSEERRRWWERGLWGSIISLAAVEFWRLFSSNKG